MGGGGSGEQARTSVSAGHRRTYRPMAARLVTERLVMSPFRTSDASRYASLIAERGPGARGFGTTVDQARANIARLAAEAAETGIGFLAVRRRGEDEMIGYCGLLIGRASLAEPEIAYELFRSVHGQGFATEAAGALVQAAAATGRERLWSTVGSWNSASLRVLDKLGFRRDRVVTQESGGDTIYLVRELEPILPS